MKSKVNERKSMGGIQLGDVYNDQGQHLKVIVFNDPDDAYPVGCLKCTGVIMFYNEQTLGACQLIERDGQEVEQWFNYDPDDDRFHDAMIPLVVRSREYKHLRGVVLTINMDKHGTSYLVIEWEDAVYVHYDMLTVEFLVE